MVLRLVFLLLIETLSAFAQFESLSTTDDGSVLFFTTRLSQTGTDQPHHGKVFLVDSRGVRPLLVRERVIYPAPYQDLFPGAFTTNYYDVFGVSIAGDISALAISGVRECHILTGGLCEAPDQSEIYNAQGQKILTADRGSVIVSRNGRWALLVQDNFNDIMARLSVTDLETGATSALPDFLAPQRADSYGVSDDGTVIVPSYDEGVSLVHRDGTKEQLAKEYSGLRQGSIDRSGTTAAWVADGTLNTWKQGQEVSVLAEGMADPTISGDGAVVLVLFKGGNSQCLLFRTDGSAQMQVTSEPEGIRTATLSGNGGIVWAVTNRGRLLQIDLLAGTTKEFIGPTPAVLGTGFVTGTNPGLEDYFASPGQVLTLVASVAPGDRVQAQLGELTAPVLDAGNGTITVQVPWEAAVTTTPPYTPYQVEIVPEQPSGWAGTASLRVQTVLPEFTAIAHEAFEGVVDEAHPARPGEIVHLYGTGFGLVTPPVATGSPAPISPLSTLVNSLTCSVVRGIDSVFPATVLFGGLAPLTIGYNQVDLQVPETLPPGPALVSCNLANWCADQCGITIGMTVQ